MDIDRAKQIAFCAIQLLRRELRDNFSDWKDCDDMIFSELDIEIGELEELFAPYAGARVYGASCFEDGNSPKNYDTDFAMI